MPVPQYHDSGPSVWQKLKMGALMGGGVGLTMGFLFGSWSIMRYGAGPRGFLGTLSQYMLGSAATFAFFLSIGAVIRTDGTLPPHVEAALRTSPMVIRSKTEGMRLLRARWEAERQRHREAA